MASISPKAEHLFGPDWLTNSTLFAAVVVLALIVVAQLSLRRVALVPGGAQNACEWLVEFLRDLLEGIVGRHMAGRTFPLLASLFIFILSANLSGLLPGVGTVGWGEGEGFWNVEVHRPLIRPANADVNMTFSLALLFMGMWLYWTLSEVGIGGFFRNLFAPKGLMDPRARPLWQGLLIVVLNLFLIAVFLLVGGIEIVSIASRALSLPLRLYGNIFAGENLLHAMGGMAGPWWGVLISIPFYLLEVLVGVLQALVFVLLCAVYVQLSTAHGEGGHH